MLLIASTSQKLVSLKLNSRFALISENASVSEPESTLGPWARDGTLVQPSEDCILWLKAVFGQVVDMFGFGVWGRSGVEVDSPRAEES